MSRVLVEKGSDVDARDGHQRTPLHKASAENNARVVEMLINNKADVSVVDADGRTPLHNCSQKELCHSCESFDWRQL